MENSHLHVLWTNADTVTAEKMVFMYTVNALKNGWWENVTLIVWGAPAKLVGQDAAIQKMVKKALAAGVHITACKACCDQLGVTEAVAAQGIEIKYWGQPLTDLLKGGAHLLTI